MQTTILSVRGAVHVVPPREGSRTVDLNRILTELRTEHQLIVDAIVNLERLVRGRGKRRGRPPKWLQQGRGTRVRPGKPPRRQPEPRR